jgi:malate dehydrogenase
MQNKVSIIGAGMTGSTTAHWLAEREIADLVLVDILEGTPQGKALDLQESLPIISKDVRLTGSNDFEATVDSDIILIAAGMPRKSGMSRDDLLHTNAEIVQWIAQETIKRSPKALYIVLTNPLDAMAYLTLKATSVQPHRVVGQAGILDSARMRAFVAMETGVSVENIHCYVLGGHGDEMVPLTHISNVAGIPLDELLSPEKLDFIVNRTRRAGGEIIDLLQTGSAYYAPAAAVAQMVEAILKDKHLILPCSVLLQGKYGLKDIFFGAPVQLGRVGVERIIEYKLSSSELASLQKSAISVTETISKLKI